jgi:hypothetical protein
MARANEIQFGGQHYKGAKFQHWDLIARNRIGYLEGCASKYASRWDKKGQPLVDLEKGVHYIDKILEQVVEHGYTPSGSASYEDLRIFFDENSITDRDAQLTISHLCTWDSVTALQLARKHMVALLEKAQAQAA